MSTEDFRDLEAGLADEDPEIREESAQALAESGDARAAPLLRKALDDESEGVRMWGAFGLGKLGTKEHLGVLKKIAQGDENALVRLWATFAVANGGEREQAGRLVQFLDDESLDVRNNAADALASLASPELV